VAVDEEGTEAAAATAITVGSGAPQEPVVMTVDRSFIYLIRDSQANTILFLGRVLNPGLD
jgi:serpin B